MSRIKSIDAFRGFCIFIMIFYHPILWWTIASQVWMLLLIRRILFIEASLFIFVSGISVVLSLRKRIEKSINNPNYSQNKIFKEHYTRSLILLLFATIYNLFTNIWVAGISGIWSWHILFTIAVCYLISYPLIKLSLTMRLVFTIFIVLITYPILILLQSLKFEYPDSGWSILYHIIFNPIEEYTIFPNLAFFSLGTVCGEIFYKIYNINDVNLRKTLIKNKIVRRFFIFGLILMISSLVLSVLILDNSFTYLNRNTTICTLFGIGWALFLISIFTYFHEFKYSSKWRYPFFFYFSIYSLTLYLIHNVVALLFWQSLNIIASVIIAVISTIGFWYLSKLIYDKYGSKVSLKNLFSIGSVKKTNK